MCPLIFGSFTHYQVVILTGYLAIVTLTNREKSSGSTSPMVKVPHSPLLYFINIGVILFTVNKNITEFMFLFTSALKGLTGELLNKFHQVFNKIHLS